MLLFSCMDQHFKVKYLKAAESSEFYRQNHHWKMETWSYNTGIRRVKVAAREQLLEVYTRSSSI